MRTLSYITVVLGAINLAFAVAVGKPVLFLLQLVLMVLPLWRLHGKT